MSSKSFATAALTSAAGTLRYAAYIRVSSDDQNLDVQISLLKAQKPGKTYSDIGVEQSQVVERIRISVKTLRGAR